MEWGDDRKKGRRGKGRVSERNQIEKKLKGRKKLNKVKLVTKSTRKMHELQAWTPPPHRHHHTRTPMPAHLNYSQSMRVPQCGVLQLPLTFILWQLKTCYTHYHNHRRHHCHQSSHVAIKIHFSKTKSDQIDWAHSDNKIRLYQSDWRKRCLFFCFFSCVCVAVAREFSVWADQWCWLFVIYWSRDPTLVISTVDELRIKFRSLVR